MATEKIVVDVDFYCILSSLRVNMHLALNKNFHSSQAQAVN